MASIEPPASGPQAPEPSWEDSVEAELAALRREVERLNHELIKVGSQTARAERQRHAKRETRR
jgi:hypothetical protein